MMLSWTAAGVLEAEKQFRPINGYRDLQPLSISHSRHTKNRPRALPSSERQRRPNRRGLGSQRASSRTSWWFLGPRFLTEHIETAYRATNKRSPKRQGPVTLAGMTVVERCATLAAAGPREIHDESDILRSWIHQFTF